MAVENNRRMDITIYFDDSPSPVQVKNVCHIGTEGGLLRIIYDDDQCQWWPMIKVFNIRQDKRYDNQQ